MQAPRLSRWPVPGGLLERLGLPPEEVEGRSRQVARELVGGSRQGDEAELAATLLYASGDPSLGCDLRFGGDPVGRARTALRGGAAVLTDVTMVAAGVRLPAGRRMAVAVGLPSAGETALRSGVTRAAAGIRLGWDEFGAGGIVVVGNAPTALLAVLDLAKLGTPPACVIATCPGFSATKRSRGIFISSSAACNAVTGASIASSVSWNVPW